MYIRFCDEDHIHENRRCNRATSIAVRCDHHFTILVHRLYPQTLSDLTLLRCFPLAFPAFLFALLKAWVASRLFRCWRTLFRTALFAMAFWAEVLLWGW